MIDKGKEGVSIEELLVMKDFKDVFPEELPGLPPKREIKNEIELLPGTMPIL